MLAVSFSLFKFIDIECGGILKNSVLLTQFNFSCNLINGTYVSEGSMFDLKDQEVPQTTDVVFIVEATACNHNLPVNKNMPNILAALEKAFGEVGLSNAR